MAVYDITGTALSAIYELDGEPLSLAYDIDGTEIYSGGAPDEPWIKTLVRYDLTNLITEQWLTNAATQRDAVKTLYQASNDAIPFFIQTDGHGRFNEGNKGCHNLAEETMRYITNIMLGDYASYYSDGANPANHARTSEGISNYISAMGNHEFLNNNSADAELADLPTLIASYTPSNAILGSQTYGYYKILDSKHGVKYLVTQPHIPDENDSGGFIWKMTGDQYEWLIDELESNDGFDVVIIQHEEINGTYTQRNGTTYIRNIPSISISEILAARKAKTSGSYTDSDGVTHNYDFTNCQNDLMCSLHGHEHAEAYITKNTYGFPVYVGDDFDNDGRCAYGLIDRADRKLYIYSFGKSLVDNALILDL